MSTTFKTEKNGYLIAFLGGFILSIDTVLIRAINLPPDQIAFWRSLSLALPVVILTLFALLKSRKKPALDSVCNKDILLSSFFYGISSVMFPMSAMLTSIANMLFIISTAPLWAAIISWIFIRESVNKVTLLSFLISIPGVLVVIYGTHQTFTLHPSIGDITSLVTAISMASAFVVGRSSKRDLSLSPSIGAILSAVAISAFFKIDFHLTSQQLFMILLEGSVVVFISLSLIAKSSRLIPSSHLGLFLLLETIFGPIWIYLFYREIPEQSTIIGGCIILIALMTNSLYSINRLKNAAPAA